jgi:hypothetical protein
MRVYPAWKIINWRTTVAGSRRILSMVVLQEEYPKSDDGYVEVLGKQWRVLSLVNGVYYVQLFRDTAPNWPVESSIPVNAEGKTFDQIPFTFVGSDDNDPDIDDPPLYDLAVINVAHYRNSADYEESVFITGQPTPWFSGLTENWVKNVLKNSVQLGSRAAIPLPTGATAGLLQVQANSLPHEAMAHKERLMSALGAKVVEQRQVQRTATEAGLEVSDETSTLSTTADNVSDAFEFAIRACCAFVGADAAEVDFDLNTEFDLIKLTFQERQQVVAEWIAQAISWDEMRANLRRAGIASVDDKTALEQIKANPPPDKLIGPPLVGDPKQPAKPTAAGPTPGPA